MSAEELSKAVDEQMIGSVGEETVTLWRVLWPDIGASDIFDSREEAREWSDRFSDGPEGPGLTQSRLVQQKYIVRPWESSP